MNAQQIKGILAIALLFFLCFLIIHAVKLAIIGLQVLRNPPKKTQSEPQKIEPEKIYYIVERKKKQSKKQYGKPKQIDFK